MTINWTLFSKSLWLQKLFCRWLLRTIEIIQSMDILSIMMLKMSILWIISIVLKSQRQKSFCNQSDFENKVQLIVIKFHENYCVMTSLWRNSIFVYKTLLFSISHRLSQMLCDQHYSFLVQINYNTRRFSYLSWRSRS